MKSLYTTAIVLIVLVGGAAFFGGMKYQQGKTPQFQGQFPGGQFPGGPGPGSPNQQRNGGPSRQGFRPVTGEIIEKDSSSITVKLTDGSSKIVNISKNTSISKTSEGSTSDLKKSTKVGVFGTENSDGSVSAQNIQLNPRFRVGNPQAGGQFGGGDGGGPPMVPPVGP